MDYQFHNLVMRGVTTIVEMVIEHCRYSRMSEYIGISLHVSLKIRDCKILKFHQISKETVPNI